MKGRIASLIILAALVGACRDDAAPSIYAPGRSHAPTAGKRVSILDASGNPTFKLRRLPTRLKVYDPDTMSRVGHVQVKDDGHLSVHDARTQTTFEVETGAVQDFLVVEGYFRLERVENGWAVMDASAATVAYVARDEDGAWTLRESYSSPPRLIAARNDDGQSVLLEKSKVVQFSYDRSLEPATLLAASVEALDPLARIVLGEWLRQSES